MKTQSTRLGYLVTQIKTGPFGSALSADEYVGEGVPLINPSDLSGGHIHSEGAVKVAEAVAARLSAYRLIEGDLVVGRRGELGRYGYVTSSEVGALCGTGSLLVRPASTLDASFLGYVLETSSTRSWLSLHSVGSTMENLSEAILARLPVPTFPLAQQELIANFLDDKTARIDALIAEKERLATAVREYEQAEISRLLTHGVRSSSLQKTGKPFVTEVPSGWRATAFKRALIGMGQGWSPQCENQPALPGEWGVLKVGCVNGTTFDANENKALPAELEPDLSCVLRKGDVLMSRANTKDLVGMAALVEEDYPQLMLCDKLYRLELRADWVLPTFAVLALRSDTSRQQIELGANGASSSMQNISQDVVRELVVAFPPLEEQRVIVQKAREVRTTCGHLADHVEEHISRLREYRSSLISAAVTGQLDVGSFEGTV